MNSDPRPALSRNTCALVLAGGRGSRLAGLTDHRAKPAAPFAGTMRIVDKRCGLPDGFTVGIDPEHDRARFHVTERGICLVTPQMLKPR